MTYFQSINAAHEFISELESEISQLIEADLRSQNCSNLNLDNWMDLYSKNEAKREKFLKLCNLEMSLIDAQLFLEHQKV
ncbi:MAG: hypothetical protein NE327_08470 [Lentisphaeraceae bacterium]|nr:hypothetical protein [Lentisphaeraceae bacterium]